MVQCNGAIHKEVTLSICLFWNFFLSFALVHSSIYNQNYQTDTLLLLFQLHPAYMRLYFLSCLVKHREGAPPTIQMETPCFNYCLICHEFQDHIVHGFLEDILDSDWVSSILCNRIKHLHDGFLENILDSTKHLGTYIVSGFKNTLKEHLPLFTWRRTVSMNACCNSCPCSHLSWVSEIAGEERRARADPQKYRLSR